MLRIRLRLAVTGLCAGGLIAAAPASAGDWPMFHQNKIHQGYSGEATFSVDNVARTGLQWQANTGSAAYGSPSVAAGVNVPGKGLRTVVYVGNQTGTMSAYDADTGDRLWAFDTPKAIVSTPAIIDPDGNGPLGKVVYFGAADDKVYARHAGTGAALCTFFTGGNSSSSPLLADPDGAGPAPMTMYIGDNGPTGADDGGHMWAINAVNCAKRWVFSGFEQPGSGSWSPPAFAKDRNGRPLLFFGSSSPDNAVYAVNALTGARVWRFRGQTFARDNDVGAGPTISPPGVNGFTDGRVYITGKAGIMYSLNLRTGVKHWQFSMRDDSPAPGTAARSTAAFSNRYKRLYVGYGDGMYYLNSSTGEKVLKTMKTPEMVSSPAFTGPDGKRVIFVGDAGGALRAFSAGNGRQLWSYDTRSLVWASPAIADGKVFITSATGFLYAFGLGGGVNPKPATTLVQPASGTNPYPNDLVLRGTASDSGTNAGVREVLVAVKEKNSGKWWDPVAERWSGVFQQFAADLSNAGGASTNWTARFPTPENGGAFFVQAEAIDVTGQHDPEVASAGFELPSLVNPPDTVITSPQFKDVFHIDAVGDHTTIPIRGTATDSGGVTPGIAKVWLVVKNIEHGEYFCNFACTPGSTHNTMWQPGFTVFEATVDNPGATSVNWTAAFPTYDHEHKYSITAWAEDRDGNVDPFRARVDRVCVRLPGDNTCA